MSRFFRIILLICGVSVLFADVGQVTLPHTAIPGAPVSSTGYNGNFGVIRDTLNKVIDTLNQAVTALSDSVPRYADFEGGSYPFQNMAVDTINDSITSDEVGALNGITANIQGQLDLKLNNIFQDDLGTIGIGITTLKNWRSDRVAVQIGGNSAIVASDMPGVGNRLYEILNAYHDTGSIWRRISTAPFSMIIHGDGLIRFYVDTAGPADSAFSPTLRATIDTTGLDVSGPAKADSFTTDGEDYFIYEDTTFYDSLFSGDAFATAELASGLARIIRIGNMVHLHQPGIRGPIQAGDTAFIVGIPEKYLPRRFSPDRTIFQTTWVINNSSNIVGSVGFIDDVALGVKMVITQGPGYITLLDPGSGGLLNNILISWQIGDD